LIEQSQHGQEDSDLLELALSEVQRLSQIVQRLRDVYRPAVQEGFELTRLPPLFKELELLLEMHLRRNAVTLELPSEELKSIWIKAYPDQLKQVFLNLSLNAIEAMQPEGGVLSVGTLIDTQKNRVGVTFSDTGLGVPEADLKVIFDPFYTTKSTGLGLGLSIVYDIVHNHGGMIEVMNNLTEGATFTIWLPIADGDQPENSR
jgi:signal transduction histidine kinase